MMSVISNRDDDPVDSPALSVAAGSLARVMVGSDETRLVVLRGNSASGKSSVVAGIRDRFGRGLALVGQDNLRRIVLRERDRPGAANIGLIDLTARYALDAGYHVVVEGLLYADHYGEMLARLRADHRGPTHGYYLHVPFEQTLARHATKPIAHEVSEPQLRDWYRELDLLPGGIETVIEADSTLAETVDRIMLDTGLTGLPALEH
jgi:predicted ABC-type ATPase